jgi:copper chaperone NosL
MNITDNKFAAEIVTKKGKIYKFDSIECLFNFKNLELKDSEIYSEWVNDFANPGSLINLEKAYFLQSDVFRSPMGLNVLSFSSREKRDEFKNQYGGKELTYNELFEFAIKE